MELKLCSLVAVGTGSVAKIAGNFRAFGKKACIANFQSINCVGWKSCYILFLPLFFPAHNF